MEINYAAVLVSSIIFMAIGFVWYGPLFGKFWMELTGSQNMTPEQMKAMQKRMGPVYLLNFALTFLSVSVLAYFANNTFGNLNSSALCTAFLIWLGFIMPTVAGNAMWSGKPRKMAWKMFFVSAAYQFVCFLLAGWIIGMWI